jgi:hypothetical protein
MNNKKFKQNNLTKKEKFSFKFIEFSSITFDNFIFFRFP